MKLLRHIPLYLAGVGLSLSAFAMDASHYDAAREKHPPTATSAIKGIKGLPALKVFETLGVVEHVFDGTPVKFTLNDKDGKSLAFVAAKPDADIVAGAPLRVLGRVTDREHFESLAMTPVDPEKINPAAPAETGDVPAKEPTEPTPPAEQPAEDPQPAEQPAEPLAAPPTPPVDAAPPVPVDAPPATFEMPTAPPVAAPPAPPAMPTPPAPPAVEAPPVADTPPAPPVENETPAAPPAKSETPPAPPARTETPPAPKRSNRPTATPRTRPAERPDTMPSRLRRNNVPAKPSLGDRVKSLRNRLR
ncbi:MAG: hypothetical protein ACYDCO_09250 [Armatimonadota bacterium]